MRESGAERMHVLEQIADGEPVQTYTMPFRDILSHCVCPRCNTQLEPKEPDRAGRLEFTVRGSATPKDRVQAVEVLLRYGLGPLQGVATDDVRDRLGATLDIVQRQCPPETAARIINAMRAVWTE